MKLGEQRKVPASPCTNCGAMHDGATAVDADAAPEPGDATVCIRCGHLMVFGVDLVLRNPTDAEVVKFAGDKRLLAVQWARGRVTPPDKS